MPKRGVVLIIAAVVFAAVPGSKGGEDITAVEGIFAESPNRVFVLQRREEPTS